MAPCDTLKKLYLLSMDEVFTTLARQVICDGKSNASFVWHFERRAVQILQGPAI
jgi:hypothetical protein